MSAHFTPDELRKVAPDEYARIYGKPDDIAQKNAEAARISAEVRLLNARRRLAEEERRARPKPARGSRESAAFWIALIIALAQFIFTWYVISHY